MGSGGWLLTRSGEAGGEGGEVRLGEVFHLKSGATGRYWASRAGGDRDQVLPQLPQGGGAQQGAFQREPPPAEMGWKFLPSRAVGAQDHEVVQHV